MPRGRQSTTGRAIGNTAGGRGPLPQGMTTMGQYYGTGRASAFDPDASIRGSDGKTVKKKGAGGPIKKMNNGGKSKK